MNNYPRWWNTTVTIYNRFEDPITNVVTWYRHVVHDCFWQQSGNKVTIDKTVLDTKNIICRIRISDKYLSKHLWQQVPNDKMSNYFTLGPGDIIIKDEVDDEVNEYQSNKRSTDLLKKYKALQGCMQIEEFSDNTGGGRGNEHYYVRGI